MTIKEFLSKEKINEVIVRNDHGKIIYQGGLTQEVIEKYGEARVNKFEVKVKLECEVF